MGAKQTPPDPIKWVERLLVVNEGSAFDKEEKVVIDTFLKSLIQTLEKIALS